MASKKNNSNKQETKRTEESKEQKEEVKSENVVEKNGEKAQEN